MNEKKIQKTLKPIYEIQKEAHEKYLVNPRTFQWYVTKGLLPKAIKTGREAFYDIDQKKINVYDYLATVKLLQNLYSLGTDKIKHLITVYNQQLKLLSYLLKELAEKYPAGIPLISANWEIQKDFLEMISGEEALDLRSIDLDVIKKQVKQRFANRFDPLA